MNPSDQLHNYGQGRDYRKRGHALLFVVLAASLWFHCRSASQIDRYSLVTRHHPKLFSVDPWNPFTVGNGGFAFTADVTGLQTFPDSYYQNGIPLETLSDWAWHSFPNPENYTLEDAFEILDLNGRKAGYPSRSETPAGQWLRANPHRIPLGQIGFEFHLADSSQVTPENLSGVEQTLDLWSGILKSRFVVNGRPVSVSTLCHPWQDLIAVRIVSPLALSGALSVSFRFPYSHDPRIKNDPPFDWAPEKHTTQIIHQTKDGVTLRRRLDDAVYFVKIAWSGDASFAETAAHQYRFTPSGTSDDVTLSIAFSPDDPSAPLPAFPEVQSLSAAGWKDFWMSGGAVGLLGSRDPRAQELERRIVLSQYLTRVQCAGDMPPQESGLTLSSWYGKFHTEMAWWNTAHFLLWGRDALLKKNFAWYHRVLPHAQETARQQGFTGARWSKMVGPEGRESPGGNPFILWNQSHPIYLAEMIYRADLSPEVLQQYQEIVLETAAYMADFVTWNAEKQRYDLGPPVWPVQEIFDPKTAQNPAFELAYWAYGLELSQTWRVRLGLPRVEKWDEVIARLAPLPVWDSLYVALESDPCTFTRSSCRDDHPSMLMPLGFLPGQGVDREIMGKTLDAVIQKWNFDDKIWGWDYPMIAMTAARLGEPELAVQMLLADKTHNRYLLNGHCPQVRELPVYLPANGALLSAVALMAAGWDGAPKGNAPGFPKDGNWKVRWEGLRKMP